MGLRIELLLFVSIIVITLVSFTTELASTIEKTEKFTKELEFTYTTFREVDKTKLQAIAYGTYGMRDSGILSIDNLVYQTEKIESLVAQKGRYKGSIIYLEGNVIFHDSQGYNCETEQAEYDQDTEILNITSPYIATRAKNIVFGDTLTYNTRSKEAYGTVIDAIVYTVEK